MQKSKLALNILVLIALIATVSLGWLAGHIIRFSIPELWHPPIENIIPGEKIGVNLELPPEIVERNTITNWSTNVTPMMLLSQCKSDVYYTSLPAKCRSVDGRLVRVGGVQQEIMAIPWSEAK